MHQRRALELKASAAGMTVWDYLKAKNAREPYDVIRIKEELRHQEQSARAAKAASELWDRRLALIEKRHAFTMEQLEKVDQRVQRDAEEFLSKVKTAPDDNAVISEAALNPRLFYNEQAYDAYKKALARMDAEGRKNVAGLSDESRLRLKQLLTDAIKEAKERDEADRAKLFAELDEIKKDSDAQAQEERDFTYRNQVLDNQRNTASEIRQLRKEVQDSNNRLINEVNRAEWRLRNW
jgi:hypothetical protein